MELNAASLSFVWGLPFAGILLSIALLSLWTPDFWHNHFGKIAAGWALAFIVPFSVVFGVRETAHQLAHALLLEYAPFIVVLFALYTVAGGICVFGNLHGSPRVNTGLIAIATLLASVMGTTGAAMLLVRPLIRANDNRRHVVHTMVFFIMLVANAGGALTPLGDPPLFLGFLQGVDFFWTARFMLPQTLMVCGTLLALFYALDSYFYRLAGEEAPAQLDPTPDSALRIVGKVNFVLLAAVVCTVLLSGVWRPGGDSRYWE